MVKIKSINVRMYKSPKAAAELKEKLKKLTDASNLPSYMGEILLREILLSTDEPNRHLRERAVLLGLAQYE